MVARHLLVDLRTGGGLVGSDALTQWPTNRLVRHPVAQAPPCRAVRRAPGGRSRVVGPEALPAGGKPNLMSTRGANVNGMTVALASVFGLIGVIIGQLLARGGEYRKWIRIERHVACARLLEAAEAIHSIVTNSEIVRNVAEISANKFTFDSNPDAGKELGITYLRGSQKRSLYPPQLSLALRCTASSQSASHTEGRACGSSLRRRLSRQAMI